MDVLNNKQQLFDRWAPFYDCPFTSIFYQAVHVRLLDYAELPEQANVLDIGCGTGRLLNRLVAKYPNLQGTGLDFSSEMLLEAGRSSRYPLQLTFVQGNATPLSFADAQFDAIFNTISFLHYPDPTQVLAEVYRTLKPGGMFYLVDLVGRSLTRIGHDQIKLYSREQRQQMGQQVGLECVKHQHLLGPVLLTIFHKSS
ncbi:MAG: class I SAM-dependent methyltransferase [Cyanobacteria bacterium P01_F01_bin.150]